LGVGNDALVDVITRDFPIPFRADPVVAEGFFHFFW